MERNNSYPLVSVILPSYNHGKYISEAIDSVLNQDYDNFELLISDDASQDNTVEVIKSYSDPRIKVNFLKKNQGATINTQTLIKQARGKYIALINSDDVWLPGKLKKQVEFLENNDDYGACFSWAKLIDENSEDIKVNDLVFNQQNRTQAEWFRFFFTNGNCICHPSMLIRAEVYTTVGTYNLAMRQLPDFDMWVRLIKKYNIHIIQEVLVAHRRFINYGENTSSPTISNSIRDINESSFILSKFFDGVSDELFEKSFRCLFRKKGKLTKEELACEKFFLMLDGKYYMKTISILSAVNYFLSIYSMPGIADTFKNTYNFTMMDFHKITGRLDLLNMLPKDINTNEEVKFDIERYIRDNKVKVASILIFNKDSKLYRILRRLYFKILNNNINGGKK